MAYFYVVAKTKNDYDLIKIDDGNSLEDIDLYTTKFKNKNDFIKHLNNEGLKLPKDTDLFIATKSKDGQLIFKELMYDNKDLEELAKASKEKNVNTLKIFGKFVNISIHSTKLKEMFDNKLFTYYDSIRSIINKSLGRGSLTLDKQDTWVKNSYRAGRDLLYGLDYYENEKENFDSKRLEQLQKEQQDRYFDRMTLEKPLLNKIKEGFDQILMVGEPSNSINLTYVNLEKMLEDKPHVLKRKHIPGIMKETNLEELTIPIDIMEEEAPENMLPVIGNFLINPKNMPFGSIKEIKNKEKKTGSYEINFDVLEKNHNIKYSDEDKKILSGLLGSELKKNLFFTQVYKKNIYSTEAQKEASHYEQQVFKTLDKYEKKQPNMFNKAHNFYLIQSKMISNTKRGGHGSK